MELHSFAKEYGQKLHNLQHRPAQTGELDDNENVPLLELLNQLSYFSLLPALTA